MRRLEGLELTADECAELAPVLDHAARVLTSEPLKRLAMATGLERPAKTTRRLYARDEPTLRNWWPRENGTLPDRLSFPVLDSRAQLLLKMLIERYIAEGQPVGSRALSKHSGLELSPATIQELRMRAERVGWIVWPDEADEPLVLHAHAERSVRCVMPPPRADRRRRR